MNAFRSIVGCACLPLLLCSPLSGAANDNASLGINLSGVTYWSAEMAFVDLFRHSQTFKSQAPGKSYGQGGTLDLTPEGWVRSLAGGGQFADSIVLTKPRLGYPAGTYNCFYEGDGKIEFAHGTQVLDERKGQIRVAVETQNLASLQQLSLKLTRGLIRMIRCVTFESCCRDSRGRTRSSRFIRSF